MSFSRYDDDANQPPYMHCCIKARRATHCATGDRIINHTIIRAAFVCLCVRNQSPPRSFDGSSPNLVGVCRLTSHLPLRDSFSKRSMASRVNGPRSLSTILHRDQPHITQLQRHLLLGNQQSLIRRLLLWCIPVNNLRWQMSALCQSNVSSTLN